MATVTPINRPRGQTRSGVAAVLNYVMQRHKAEYNGQYLVTGINCQVETCCTEFISTKLQYHKMNSRFEQRNTQPTMEEIQAMQKTALRRSMDKAGNIQKAITLTEENWTGLTTAVEMTGQSVLKLQQSVGHLLTDEQMDAMLKAQLQSLMAEHSAAVSEMKRTVAELNRSSTEYWQRMQRTATESLNDLYREQTQALKEFEKQVGRVSERYSSELSATTDSIKQSANPLRLPIPSHRLIQLVLIREEHEGRTHRKVRKMIHQKP